MGFHVKVQNWVKGVLETVLHEYYELEHAIEHAMGIECNHVKVYDQQGRLVYERKGDGPKDHDHDSYSGHEEHKPHGGHREDHRKDHDNVNSKHRSSRKRN